MRLSIALTIFKKELLETLRDRRTLLMAIGVPILFYPLVLIAVTRLVEVKQGEAEARASALVVWGDPPEALRAHLATDQVVLSAPWSGIDPALRAELAAGRIAPPSPDTAADQGARDQDATEAATAGGNAQGSKVTAGGNAQGSMGTAGAKPPGAKPSGGKKAQGEQKEAEEAEPPETPLRANARRLLTARDADAVVVVWPEQTTAAETAGIRPIAIYYDSVRDASSKALDRARAAVQAYKQAVIQERLASRGLPSDFDRPVSVSEQNVAPPARKFGHFLGGILPLLLVLLSTLGTLYPAIDMTAGEKERGTMQTLLCSPITPVEILLGKLMAVWVIAILTAGVNLASVAATAARTLGSAMMPSQLSISTWFLVFAMLLPLIMVLSSLYFAICVFARDFKDAQNLITPFYFALSFLPAIATVPGVELSTRTAFIPIVNMALLVKAVLISEARLELVFLTMISSLAFGALALLFAARVFSREQVVLGGREPLRVVLGLERSAGGLPSPTFVAVLYALVMVVQFYGSLALEGTGIVASLLSLQYGMILVPVLAAVVGFGFSPVQTLKLRPPPVRGLIAAALLGASTWTFAAGVLVRILPPPEDLTQGLKKVLLLGDQPGPLWLALAVLAVTPAICEELYFRGFILSGLRTLGRWPAIVLTAVLFGVLHASIYRLLPTAFLGLVMCYAVWKTGSIFVSMLVHLINNGVAVLLLHLESPLLEGADALPWSITLAGTGVMIAALLLLRSMPLVEETAPLAPPL